jgi:transcriptional regulator with PAS, ATPase and Fis domain
LRAGLLRFLSTHRDRTFDIVDLMQSFGRMRLDIENCLVELVNFGVASRHESGAAPTYEFREPPALPTRELVDEFLQRQAPVTRTAAKSDIAVLILGATGSGKELVARMIHELSRRSPHRFQTVNCAALPESLFESELFGHEKGAFTGAQERKLGRFELAHKGTLFLDEIGDLAVVSQAKLLRALEERRIERLGSSEPIDVDFRLVSSTNRPLDLLVREEQFREDLYYRINAFAIRLPSLRERTADIPILATRALARHCEASQLAPDAKVLSKEALEMLSRYHWPGNIRELESTLSRAAMSTTGRVIRPADLELLHAPDSLPTPPGAELQSLAQAERAHIVRVLEAVRWNKKHAAQVLEISRGTLYRKILEYGLESRVRH